MRCLAYVSDYLSYLTVGRITSILVDGFGEIFIVFVTYFLFSSFSPSISCC